MKILQKSDDFLQKEFFKSFSFFLFHFNFPIMYTDCQFIDHSEKQNVTCFQD